MAQLAVFILGLSQSYTLSLITIKIVSYSNLKEPFFRMLLIVL